MVSAGSSGKGEMSQVGTGMGASKSGEACWSQTPQDSNEARDTFYFHQ